MNELNPEQPQEMLESPPEAIPGLTPELSETTEASFVTESPRSSNSTALLLLGVVVLGGALIYLMRLKAGPQAAVAATTESVAAKATISEFLNDGNRSRRVIQDLLANTHNVVEQFKTTAAREPETAEELRINPFQFATKSDDADEKEAARKEQARIAAEKEKQHRQEIVQAVQKLRLQSIMAGKVGTCIINNHACTEGQEINGFVVEKIERESVIVRRETYRYQLRMQR